MQTVTLRNRPVENIVRNQQFLFVLLFYLIFERQVLWNLLTANDSDSDGSNIILCGKEDIKGK